MKQELERAISVRYLSEELTMNFDADIAVVLCVIEQGSVAKASKKLNVYYHGTRRMYKKGLEKLKLK